MVTGLGLNTGLLTDVTQPISDSLPLLLHEHYIRGGIFSRSSVFQAFSHVMVIIDEVSTLERGPFAISGPHPAILLFDFPIIGPKKKLS